MLVQRTKIVHKDKKTTGNPTKQLVNTGHAVDIAPIRDTNHVCITAEAIKGKVTQVILSDNDLWKVMRAWIGRMPIVQRDLDKTLAWLSNLKEQEYQGDERHLRCIGRRLIACHASLALVLGETKNSIQALGDSVQAGDEALDNLKMFRDQIRDMMQGVPIQQPTKRPTKKKVPKKRAGLSPSPKKKVAKKKLRKGGYLSRHVAKGAWTRICTALAKHNDYLPGTAPSDRTILNMGRKGLLAISGISALSCQAVRLAILQGEEEGRWELGKAARWCER